MVKRLMWGILAVLLLLAAVWFGFTACQTKWWGLFNCDCEEVVPSSPPVALASAPPPAASAASAPCPPASAAPAPKPKVKKVVQPPVAPAASVATPKVAPAAQMGRVYPAHRPHGTMPLDTLPKVIGCESDCESQPDQGGLK